MRWKITVEAWPHSMGITREEAQEKAGPRSRTFEADAEDMTAALKVAKAFAAGIASHPLVWQAPIMAIVRIP